MQIPENKITRLSIGLHAKIYINVLPYMEYQIFEGKLKEILISPSINQQLNTLYYKGAIEIIGSNFNRYVKRPLIRPGMKADVKVIIKTDTIIKLIFSKFKKGSLI